MRARGEASSAHVRVLHPLPEPAVLEPRRAMGKKPKGPMTVDALGNAVSVAELEERKAAEEARAAAKARREAKAAARASSCLLCTSPSPRDRSLSRMPSSA